MDYIDANLLFYLYIIIREIPNPLIRNCPPYINSAARSDTMEAESEMLPPGGDAAITRQQFQRAFAQEFLCSLEVWPESHWPGFALRQSDVLQAEMAK